MRKSVILFALFLFALSAQAQTFSPVRVNLGGPAYTDANGNVWQADMGCSGGAAYQQFGAPVSGTKDATLFDSIRYAPQGGNFTCTYAVPNGAYTVNLSFAELWGGHRSVNVLVNVASALTGFDVFAKVGGGIADIESIPVTVTTGSISIELDSIGGNGYIDAIEIVQANPPPPQPVTVVVPGFGSLQFVMASPPAFCGAGDGTPCTIQFQVCDTSTPPTCSFLPFGTLSLVKTVTLPTPQTQTTPVVVAGP